MRNVPGIVFAIVFVTRFYIYPESFIPKYFMLDDLLRKNHFHRLQPRQMTAIIKWTCPRTLDPALDLSHVIWIVKVNNNELQLTCLNPQTSTNFGRNWLTLCMPQPSNFSLILVMINLQFVCLGHQASG